MNEIGQMGGQVTALGGLIAPRKCSRFIGWLPTSKVECGTSKANDCIIISHRQVCRQKVLRVGNQYWFIHTPTYPYLSTAQYLTRTYNDGSVHYDVNTRFESATVGALLSNMQFPIQFRSSGWSHLKKKIYFSWWLSSSFGSAKWAVSVIGSILSSIYS